MPSKRTISFYNPLDPMHPKIWTDYTLILPICAVGNIGQLACDLIISTLLSRQECHLIGRIYSPALMPVVGPNAFSSRPSPPTTTTEIYESKKHRLVIVQQRTSYLKSLKHLYIQELIDWLKESKFDQILVLTSSFAQCNPDLTQLGDLGSCPIRTVTTSSFNTHSDKWRRLGLKRLPQKRELKVVTQDWLTYLPGSGLTKQLIRACEKEFIPAAFLVDFCSEGINLYDCYQVVNVVDQYLDLCSSVDLQQIAGDTNDKCLESTSTTQTSQDSYMKKWVEPYSWYKAQC